MVNRHSKSKVEKIKNMEYSIGVAPINILVITYAQVVSSGMVNKTGVPGEINHHFASALSLLSNLNKLKIRWPITPQSDPLPCFVIRYCFMVQVINILHELLAIANYLFFFTYKSSPIYIRRNMYWETFSRCSQYKSMIKQPKRQDSIRQTHT